jgi:hypothetical protein
LVEANVSVKRAVSSFGAEDGDIGDLTQKNVIRIVTPRKSQISHTMKLSTFTTLHGVPTQNTIIDVFTVVRTSSEVREVDS